MIPKRQEWKSWSALDRTAYIAQMAATLSLLPTVMFAWLGWREARVARLEQVKFFQAANAPEVELSEVKLVPTLASEVFPPTKTSEGVLTLVLRNTGATPAFNIKFSLFLPGQEEKPLSDNRAPDDIFKNLAIPRSKDLILPIKRIEDIEREIGWRPTIVEIRAFGSDGTAFGAVDNDATKESTIALLAISFNDAFDKSYSRIYSIRLAR